LRKTRIVTRSADILWEARGQVIEFAGYTTYWHNLKDDRPLPRLQQHQPVTLTQATADPKQTQPPPRYTEPTLVQLMERKGIGRPSTYAPTIKTLKSRAYVQLVKAALQPTALGLELDAAMVKLLPDLIEPAFTAEMEAVLDAIAHGTQDWQQYLTQWHQNYFAPALAQAGEKLGTLQRSSSTPSPGIANPVSTQVRTPRKGASSSASAGVSQVACPKCSQMLQKVPSQSKKLKADHFLRCATAGCDGVMFWNPQGKRYELPYAQRTPDPAAFTEIPCPQCGALLEKYRYQKEGQEKVMLRCSILDHRRGKCKEVAFFQTQQGFWSPKFGELTQPVLP
jgi:DNA topoisomerase-1